MELSSCITEGLYLGSVLAALNEKDLSDKGISHILSVDEDPLPEQLTTKFVYKHVQALDVSECDLLSSFPETFNFIDQAMTLGGHVLVHCQAGMSRSATVVCAYLMEKLSVSKDKALELIVASRPCVQPNAGFMEQLDLFEAMGCQLRKTHSQYRAWQLHKLAQLFHSGHLAAGQGDMEILSGLLLETDFSSGGNDAYYKCRKCRMILFRHGAVTTHMMGKGEISFGWRGVDPTKQSPGPAGEQQQQQEACQRSLFVDPLMWMKGRINDTCGKLHCPKCDVKVGSYVWYGEKCPCGRWVSPAFHIDTGKVDKIPFQTVAPSSRVMPIPRGATNVVTTPSHASPSPSPTSTSGNLPERRDASQAMGPSHSFPPPTNTNRGVSAKSKTAIVAAVAPLVSTTTPSLPSIGDRSTSSRSMEVEGGGHGEPSRIPSTSSFPASRQQGRVIGQAVPFVNTPSTSSGAGVGGHEGDNVLMDIDS